MVALDQSYAVAGFLLRFGLTSDSGLQDDGWAIDDIAIMPEGPGDPLCLQIPGAIVQGYVVDHNRAAGVVGARVSLSGTPVVSAQSSATPGDPRLGEGFYQLFVPVSGTLELIASAPGYQSDTRALSTTEQLLHRQDFLLEAPLVQTLPPSISLVLEGQQQLSRTLWLSNTGGTSATLALEIYRGNTLQPLNPGVEPSEGPTTLAWQKLAPLPTSRTSHTSEIIGDMLYIVDGHTESEMAPSLWRYSLSADQWEDSLPPRLFSTSGSCVVALGSDLYLIGGTSGAGPSSMVQIFHSASGSWELLSRDPLPARRRGLGCEAYQGKIYVFGGYDDFYLNHSEGWVYDPMAPARSRWSPIMQLPRQSSIGRTVISGGQIFYFVPARRSDAPTGSIYAYDPASDLWSSYPASQEDHNGGIFWALDGKLYLAGGFHSKKIEVYDTSQGSSGSWSDAQPLNNLSLDASAVVNEQRGAVYLSGGRNLSGSEYEDRFER